MKAHVQSFLRRAGLYQRLKGSLVYDLYWSVANPRIIDERRKEIEFYRVLLQGFRAGDLIFDVGANHGAKTDIFLRLGAKVVAVEPDDSNQEILKEKFLRYRFTSAPVTIVGRALSDRSAIETMWIDAPGSAKNTLSQKWVDTLRTDEARFGEKLNFAQQRQVETTTIDDLITDYGCPIFVKIDVEGSEASVLRGMRRPVPFVSFEVNLPEFRPEGLECVELLRRLTPAGRFNYAVDCQHGLALERWLEAAAFAKVLEGCTEKSIEVFWKSQPQDLEEMSSRVEVSLLTGGQDRHYAVGLTRALTGTGVGVDVIGSDEVDGPELHGSREIRFHNLRGSQRSDVSLSEKAFRILAYYRRLIRYTATARPKVFHILWNNKFLHFDRTLLMAYYKLLGKKVVLTAHNVNSARRDAADSALNRLTLRIQYRLADHIFVHTEMMKRELLDEFGVRNNSVTVIPYGINDAVPETNLTAEEAKSQLGVGLHERTMLFFGNIAPYKGLEYLVDAFLRLATAGVDYRLIIAGKPKKGSERYLGAIQETITRAGVSERTLLKIDYVPDHETELYFKAADVLVLPYTSIFQSGVLFLGYSFGLPVIAADVGSLREDLIEGKTGFLCRPADSADLAKTIEAYFASDLFKGLAERRQWIREYANERHSWDIVGRMTLAAYARLLTSGRPTPSSSFR